MRSLLVLTTFFFSLSSFAFPVGPFDALEAYSLKSQEQNSFFFNESKYDYEGIVKLSNCSGSLIQFAGQPDSSLAYVLTNGHCIGNFIDPGKFVVNKATNRRMMLADSTGKYHNIMATRLVYATMTGTDSAIYELTQTYDQIKETLNIRPYLLSYNHPTTGVGIEILSGYWERGYSCNIDKFIFQLSEGGWIFTDSIKYTQPGCDTIGGTSGSPIIETGTRTVIGVNNTGNNDGEECTINNPCEVDEAGNVVVEQGASYGQQTYIFYSCLTPDFQIDLSIEECQLTK